MLLSQYKLIIKNTTICSINNYYVILTDGFEKKNAKLEYNLVPPLSYIKVLTQNTNLHITN